MFELTGKNALITGASGAIGGGIARVLHAQGATVALSGTKREVARPPRRRPRRAASTSSPAISPTAPRPKGWCRAPKRRWVSSTSWSPTPG